jgi:hypothetical protein
MDADALELEIQRLLDANRERAQKSRLEQIEKLDAESLAWLALPPVWTDSLAEACSFPSGKQGLTSFVRRVESVNLCSSKESIGVDGGKVFQFWMIEAARHDAVETLVGRKGQQFVTRTLRDIANRILSRKESTVPPTVARWAKLASFAEGDFRKTGQHTARWLVSQVRGLLSQDQTGEALAWVRAAAALSRLFGVELEAAVRLANRRVELTYRRSQDLRQLDDFLDRPELTDDLLALLNDSSNEQTDRPWALHFVGMGGVGKSMLARHLNARLVPRLGGSCSRVDFDHLSPDYPLRRPAQLLIELADELTLYATSTRHEYIVDEFRDRVDELHELLSGEQATYDPLSNLHRPEFQKVLRAFNDLLRSLPRPVVLILDTCEELAKFQPAGARMPSVEATFQILESIHSEVPWVKVVFAGRRLLAQSGGGPETNPRWKLRSAVDSWLPPHKSYLQLREIRGFTLDESNRFFNEIQKTKLDPKMRSAILKQSLEAGTAFALDWSPPRSSESQNRYNPFDLSLYARWLREDPNLSTEVIESGQTNPYVEMRIIGRLSRQMQKLMPVVTALRRFDREMLELALDLSEDDFSEAYRLLGEQEWIEFQSDQALETTFLEIDPNLYPRLLSYYGEDPSSRGVGQRTQHVAAGEDSVSIEVQRRRMRYRKAKASIGPRLAELVRARKLSQLGISHIDAALWLLPKFEAAVFWDEIHERIAAEGAWSWVQRVAGYVLGEEGAAGRNDAPIRAGLRATFCSALLHTLAGYDATDDWSEVSKTAGAYPNPATRRWLEWRAAAGHIAALRTRLMEPDQPQLAALVSMLELFPRFGYEAPDLPPPDQDRIEQMAGSLCAAVEGLLEVVEARNEPGILTSEVISAIGKWEQGLEAAGVSTEIRAFALTLSGRAFRLVKNWHAAARSITAADSVISGIEPMTRAQPTLQRWADWCAPHSLRDRVRLQFALISPMLLTHDFKSNFYDWSAKRLDEWHNESVGSLQWISSERLASRTLDLKLAQSVVEPASLISLATADIYDADRQPTCEAHRATPPLVVNVARGWLALGSADRALELLDKRIEEATVAGYDPLTVRECVLAKLEAMRRMRLRGGISLIRRTSEAETAEIPELVKAWALMPLNGLEGISGLSSPVPRSDPETLHAWWTSRATPNSQSAHEAIQTLRANFLVDNGFESINRNRIAARLDWEEGVQLAHHFNLESELVEFWPGWGSLSQYRGVESEKDWRTAFRAWAESLSDERLRNPDESDLRLVLRAWALSLVDGFRDSYWSVLGQRRISEITLEEGESLALRLPERAVTLLDHASISFAGAGDFVGATIAGIAAAIAEARMGAVELVRFRLEHDVKESYELIRHGAPGSDLPMWSELTAIANAPDPNKLDSLDRPNWSCWLQRLVRCLVWIQEPDKKGARSIAMDAWLAQNYGTSLPLELELPAVTASLAEENSSTASEIKPRLQRIASIVFRSLAAVVVRKILPFFKVLLSLGLGLLLFAACFSAFGQALDWVVGGRIWVVWQLALFIGLLISLAIIGKLRNWISEGFRSRLAAATRMSVVVQAQNASGARITDPNTPVPVTIKLRQRRVKMTWSRLQMVLEPWVETAVSASAPRFGPYREASAGIPSELVKELAELKGLLKQRRMAVPLSMPPSLVAAPWEALISTAVKVNWAEPYQEVFQFFRPAERSSFGSTAEQAWASRRVSIIAGSSWQRMLKQGWQPLHAPIVFSDGVSQLDRLNRVLHIVGKAVKTAAGVQMKIAAASYAAERKRPSIQSSRSEGLISVDALPLAAGPIVVIQADPTDEVVRTDTEREHLADLRRFAADAFNAGAQAVILLPALPPNLAVKALNLFASSLRRGSRLDFKKLLDAASEVRETISVGWAARYPETTAKRSDDERSLVASFGELAFDVTVFSRGHRPPEPLAEQFTRFKGGSDD